jgi:hypothetical protein
MWKSFISTVSIVWHINTPPFHKLSHSFTHILYTVSKSITHNFVISNPNSVKFFIAAIDEADRDRKPKQTLPGRQLTNPQEILSLMSKRKKQTLKY